MASDLGKKSTKQLLDKAEQDAYEQAQRLAKQKRTDKLKIKLRKKSNPEVYKMRGSK